MNNISNKIKNIEKTPKIFIILSVVILFMNVRRKTTFVFQFIRIVILNLL